MSLFSVELLSYASYFKLDKTHFSVFLKSMKRVSHGAFSPVVTISYEKARGFSKQKDG